MSQIHIIRVPDDGGPSVPLVRLSGLPERALHAALAAAADATRPNGTPGPIDTRPIRYVLADARADLGWTIAETAVKLSVSAPAVSMWENGNRQPNLPTWQRYAELVGYEIVARPIGGDR